MNAQFISFLLHGSNLWYAMLKRSLAASVPLMRKQFGLTYKDIGDCSSYFSFFYGIFKLVGGVLTDFIPSETVFSYGILLGSLINVAIAMSADRSRRSIVLLWGLNGLCQGAGGPALSKMVLEYIPSSSRSFYWSSLLNANNVGYLISSYLLYFPASYYGWKGPFLFSGSVGLLFFLLLSLFPVTRTTFCNETQEISTTSVEKEERKSESHREEGDDVSVSLLLILAGKVLALVCGSMLTYFFIKGISDWIVNYFMDRMKIDNFSALGLAFASEIGAISGSYSAGLLADRFPHSRVTICIAFCCITLFFLLALTTLDDDFHSLSFSWHPLTAFSCCRRTGDDVTAGVSLSLVQSAVFKVVVFGAGFGVNAPKALLPLLATEEWLKLYQTWQRSRGERSRWAGTISGIVGFCCQIGALGSGTVIGRLLQRDYDYFLLSLIASTVLLIVSLVLAEALSHIKVAVKTKEE